MITTEIKQKIAGAIKERESNYGSASKMAVALNINNAILSRIKRGETEGVLKDANWISIARKLGIQLKNEHQWKTAVTPVYAFVYGQLKECQRKSISGILCDHSGIGKTYTARCYVKENKNAVYIDCSQVKTKQLLVRAIAKEFGIANTGRYVEVYADLTYYLNSLPNPLIILDEAGDLKYEAYLELKALWNATEYSCAWYMMGADGLKKKLESRRGQGIVGYSENFSRYNDKYNKVTPDGKEEFEGFTRTQIELVAKANKEDVDLRKIVAKAGGSLRRVRTEILKQLNDE